MGESVCTQQDSQTDRQELYMCLCWCSNLRQLRRDRFDVARAVWRCTRFALFTCQLSRSMYCTSLWCKSYSVKQWRFKRKMYATLLIRCGQLPSNAFPDRHEASFAMAHVRKYWTQFRAISCKLSGKSIKQMPQPHTALIVNLSHCCWAMHCSMHSNGLRAVQEWFDYSHLFKAVQNVQTVRTGSNYWAQRVRCLGPCWQSWLFRFFQTTVTVSTH